MILQKDNRLNGNINSFGCYFMSILFHCNKRLNLMFSAGIIEGIYREVINKGYMEKDCYIKNPSAIFKHLGLKVRFTEAHEPPDRDCAENEIEILAFKYKTYTHFVVGDGYGHVAFDPLGMSNSVRLGRLHSKRIFILL